MKTSKTQNDRQSNMPRPEIRDNLDNRKNEEQDFKGDDVTHNKKAQKDDKPKKKKSWWSPGLLNLMAAKVNPVYKDYTL